MRECNIQTEKMQSALLRMQKQEDDVFREAITKHFGDCTEKIAKECTLVVTGGVRRLMHGEDILCEIYPLERDGGMLSPPDSKITLSQRYRIY